MASACTPVKLTGLSENAMRLPSGWAATLVDRISWTFAVIRTSTPSRRAVLDTCTMCSGWIALAATNRQSASVWRISSLRSSMWPSIGMSVVGRPHPSAHT